MLHQFRVVKAEASRGPFKVSTVAYNYGIHTEDGGDLLAFHWHPGINYELPHVHVGRGLGRLQRRAPHFHIPTGRLCLEEVLNFAIRELLVRPARDDWERVLETGQRAFEDWRTWPQSNP